LGTYHVTSNFTVATSTWAKFDMDQRKAVVAAANRADPQMTSRWGFQLPADAMAAVKANDSIEIIEPDAAFLKTSNDFSMSDVAERSASSELSAQFAELVKKWTAIVDEVGEDPDALAARAQDEIWSKVDLSTYGQ
jgi:hypothetical protein